MLVKDCSARTITSRSQTLYINQEVLAAASTSLAWIIVTGSYGLCRSSYIYQHFRGGLTFIHDRAKLREGDNGGDSLPLAFVFVTQASNNPESPYSLVFRLGIKGWSQRLWSSTEGISHNEIRRDPHQLLRWLGIIRRDYGRYTWNICPNTDRQAAYLTPSGQSLDSTQPVSVTIARILGTPAQAPWIPTHPLQTHEDWREYELRIGPDLTTRIMRRKNYLWRSRLINIDVAEAWRQTKPQCDSEEGADWQVFNDLDLERLFDHPEMQRLLNG